MQGIQMLHALHGFFHASGGYRKNLTLTANKSLTCRELDLAQVFGTKALKLIIPD
jgi:hypothetical protein